MIYSEKNKQFFLFIIALMCEMQFILGFIMEKSCSQKRIGASDAKHMLTLLNVRFHR